MNTKLIKKYKTEFNYYVEGGNLLYFTEVGGPYYEVTDEKWDFVCDIEFIIDDVYVEFRKALAEGKTVQLNKAEKFSDPKRGWVDLSCNCLGHSSVLFPVEYYRIKPEDSDKPKITKFKVGDWVHIPALDSVPCQFSEDLCMLGLEKWEPQSDEWCWNYVFGLVKVICKTKTEGYFLCWNPWKRVEQTITIDESFIGTLPTKLGKK